MADMKESRAASPASETAPPKTIRCSFCGKSKALVLKMVQGAMPTTLICNECVELSAEIIADSLGTSPASASETPAPEPSEAKPLFTDADHDAISRACEKLWNGEPPENPIHGPRSASHPLVAIANAAHRAANNASAEIDRLNAIIDASRSSSPIEDPPTPTPMSSESMVRGHNGIAAVCRLVLTARRLRLDEGLIYHYAEGYNGTMNVESIGGHFAEFLASRSPSGDDAGTPEASLQREIAHQRILAAKVATVLQSRPVTAIDICDGEQFSDAGREMLFKLATLIDAEVRSARSVPSDRGNEHAGSEDTPQQMYEQLLAKKLEWFEESAKVHIERNGDVDVATLTDALREAHHFTPAALHWALDVAAARIATGSEQPDRKQVRAEALKLVSEILLCERNLSEPCNSCGGWGVRTYGSTATWRGGMGGQMLTSDVCDTCWGSGDANRPWPSWRSRTPSTPAAQPETER